MQRKNKNIYVKKPSYNHRDSHELSQYLSLLRHLYLQRHESWVVYCTLTPQYKLFPAELKWKKGIFKSMQSVSFLQFPQLLLSFDFFISPIDKKKYSLCLNNFILCVIHPSIYKGNSKMPHFYIIFTDCYKNYFTIRNFN